MLTLSPQRRRALEPSSSRQTGTYSLLPCSLASQRHSSRSSDREGQDRGLPRTEGLPTRDDGGPHEAARPAAALSAPRRRNRLGRDKELARRLQKGAAEPSPQSYKEQPRSPPGGRFTGKAPRPAPNDGTSPGRTADAFRAADALDLVEGKDMRVANPPETERGHVRRRAAADLFSVKDGPGPGAHDVRAADASQRAVWRQNKLASTASRFHADEIEAQRGAVGPSPADYDTYVPSLAPKATLVGREGLKSFSEAKIEEQKWTPGAGAYDTTTPLSQVGGALGREKRGGAFAGESDGPGPGVDAMPSFLASVAETHSVSLPGASHETPLPGAAAVLAARNDRREPRARLRHRACL